VCLIFLDFDPECWRSCNVQCLEHMV